MVDDQSEKDTEARASSMESHTPGEMIAACVAGTIIWSFRWAFFGAVVAPLILAALVLLLRPEFHSMDNYTVASFLGGGIGWVVGAIGGAIGGCASAGRGDRVTTDSGPGIGKPLTGLVIVLGISITPFGGFLGGLAGVLYWIAMLGRWPQ
jgi:hypothetical protein